MSLSNRHNNRSGRHLIVVLKPSGGPLTPGAAAAAAPSAAPTPSSSLLDLLSAHGATIKPLIQPRGALPPGAVAAAGPPERMEPLSRYQAVSTSDERMDDLRAALAQHPDVEGAYIKPPGEPPVVKAISRAPSAPTPGTATPDFSTRQDYLGPAPVGVDARYAWTVPGGRGAGISIIDCEWAWNFEHEDLATHCKGAVVGTMGGSDDDHGTAVIGTVIGNNNGYGVTGISPDATLSTAVFPDDSSEEPTSSIIRQAADLLAPGDIILLEIHRPGPLAPNPPNGQDGYIAIEWWPDDFLAIAYATSRGILVVEAAGNGAQNLDEPAYSKPDPGFPADWSNPFTSGGPNSGAIIVGAGNPPAGTHGRTVDTFGFNDNYLDRARCSFSNHGNRVDCQGWGWEVTTLGGGDLQARDHNSLYTDVFSGTSSASPIVTGVLACAQGALRAGGQPLLTPAAARKLLQTTGSTQQSASGRPSTEHIGARPNLKEILNRLLPATTPAVP